MKKKCIAAITSFYIATKSVQAMSRTHRIHHYEMCPIVFQYNYIDASDNMTTDNLSTTALCQLIYGLWITSSQEQKNGDSQTFFFQIQMVS